MSFSNPTPDPSLNPAGNDGFTRRPVDPGTHGITTAWPAVGDAGRLTWDDPSTPAPTGPATSEHQASR